MGVDARGRTDAQFLKREENGAWCGRKAGLPARPPGGPGPWWRGGVTAGGRCGRTFQPSEHESGSWATFKGKNEKHSSSYQVLDTQTLFWSQELG